MDRRTILAGIPAVILAACNGQKQSASQVATDVGLIASGLSSIMPSITTLPQVTPAIAAQLQTYLDAIQKMSAQIAVIAQPSASQVQQVVQAVQAFAAIALPLIPTSAPYAVAIQAALALLPALLASVGVVGAVGKPAMSPMTARAVLAARS